MPFRAAVPLQRGKGGSRGGRFWVEPPSWLMQGAFDGPVFSSADPGSSGFPPGNDDPAALLWHRAGIFQKQPLVWPAWHRTPQQWGDFTGSCVTCWFCCVFRARHGIGKPQWRRGITLNPRASLEQTYTLPSQSHSAGRRWASGSGLAAHNQVQEIKRQVGWSFWKAINGFFFPMYFSLLAFGKVVIVPMPWGTQPWGWGFCLSQKSCGKLAGKRGLKKLGWELWR